MDINRNKKDGVEQIYGWEDLNNVPDVDTIIHLAGKAHDTKNRSEADSYFKVNTGLTNCIFDYFLQSEAGTFLFTRYS